MLLPVWIILVKIDSRDSIGSETCTPCLNEQCSCPKSSVIVLKDAVGKDLNQTQCLNCPTNSYPSADGLKCIKCPDPNMVTVSTAGGSYSCTCPSPPYYSTPVNGTCIENSLATQILADYSINSIGMVEYTSLVSSNGIETKATVKSAVMSNIFVKVAAQCKYDKNDTACQTVANMCVLQMYNRNTAECRLYTDIARLGGTGSNSDFPDWPNTVPWLYYGLFSTVDPSAVISRTLLVLLNSNSQAVANKLNFVLAKYEFDGRFVGFEEFTSQLQFCPLDEERKADFLTVGSIFDNNCYLNLKLLISQAKSTYFYELYIVDDNKNLQPIPVMIKNMFVSGEYPNKDLQPGIVSGASFVRRFYLIDLISGRSSSSGSNDQIVSVLTHATLYISLRTGSPPRLQTPYLTIKYTQRQVGALSTDDSSEISTTASSFKTIYSVSNSSFWDDIRTTLIVLIVFLCLMWAYATHNWNRRNQSPIDPVTIQVLVSWIVLAAQMISYMLFAFIFFIGLSLFIGSKGQSGSMVIVPVDSFSSNIFALGIGLLFGCSLVSVLYYLLYRQSTIDLFFIDWERSRGKLDTGNAGNSTKETPVSFWRTLFVANQWIKLQNHRRVSIEFVLFFALLFMQGLRWRNLAIPYASMNLDAVGQISGILLFTINALVWIVIIIGCVLFRFCFYDRFYQHSLLQFIDLLSMSNISLFILNSKYHGYYIHGKSVHQYADTSMIEMNENLKKEENNLVAKRGLEGECQTFSIFITDGFRQSYNKINNMLSYGNSNNFNRSNTANVAHGPARPVDSIAIKSVETISKLLSSFVGNVLKENKYIIRDPTTDEKFLGAVPILSTMSVFLKDVNGLSFASVLWYGKEFDVLLLYFLVYNLIDIYDGRVWVAATVVYIIDITLRFVRQHLGKRNVSAKTLIDERFLV
ncbi:hypothetical protein MP638_004959 [Amoeboaphelidium occidentale]|nr:hypothetical protein MP638_004959 [Amoeboaphelidium occidentale]